jgi:hypothetical protein
MTHGNLEGQLIRSNFHPSCRTCKHYSECQEQPVHPEFPKVWHWVNQTVDFPEGDLVLTSWVGGVEYQEPHGGCYGFEIEADYLIPLQLHHEQYLQIHQEMETLRKRIETLEKLEFWSEVDRASKRYEKLWDDLETILQIAIATLG